MQNFHSKFKIILKMYRQKVNIDANLKFRELSGCPLWVVFEAKNRENFGQIASFVDFERCLHENKQSKLRHYMLKIVFE
jgi:hypothetical protein